MIHMKDARPTIGVTGTNGKTTSLLMAKHIMEKCGLKPAVLDTWRGDVTYQKFLANTASNIVDCLLLEVPVETLRQNQLSGSSFHVGALTNLASDHLNSCRNLENYYHHKAKFLNELPQGAKAIFNADDPQALTLARDGQHHLITYALNYGSAIIVAENIRFRGLTSTFNLRVTEEWTGLNNRVVEPGSACVHLPAIGAHNISNALLAVTLALYMNIDLQEAANALGSFPGIRRRLEVLTRNHFLVLDDAALNPLAIYAAISAIKTFHKGRLVILHGIYGGGGQAINRENARELYRWLSINPDDLLFITRGMYHTKNKYQVQMGEEKACLGTLKENGVPFAYYPDLPDAIDSFLYHAQEGDVLLLLGGPVLHQAGDILQTTLGEKIIQRTVIRSALSPLQPVSANPT